MVDDWNETPVRREGANLHSETDADWFAVEVSDNMIGAPSLTLDVEVTVEGSDAENLEVLVLFVCEDETSGRESCTTGDLYDAGDVGGCLGRGGSTLTLVANCGLTDDSGVAYVRVQQAEGTTTCEAYSVEVKAI